MTTNPISGVTNPIVADATAPGTQAAGGAKPDSGPSGVAATSVDSGEVSHAQTLLNAISTMAQNIPSVDQQRVDQIRAAIAQGKLSVNAQNIAQRLAEIEAQLGAPSSG
ncbi:MAG: flagellar biosynthesis anti-sigma factor FlgM [Alphaproteobacteria bacterium]|nr:flagellar biosynthesis anti-sigma factor FlgM [Alphaproteobacteria bacterium]MDE2513035.1 flagellar biosynthesis anti-sigma factor FlgM [Alphaproteobacteria bacterium]